MIDMIEYGHVRLPSPVQAKAKTTMADHRSIPHHMLWGHDYSTCLVARLVKDRESHPKGYDC